MSKEAVLPAKTGIVPEKVLGFFALASLLSLVMMILLSFFIPIHPLIMGSSNLWYIDHGLG
jgi:hypothetical protein